MNPRLRVFVVAVLALAAVPQAAQARDLLDTTVTAPRNEDRDCTTRLLHGAAQPTTTLTSPAGGWITARLEGSGPGDWDLAIFEPETVKTLVRSKRFTAGRTQRASLRAAGLGRADYKVRITVRRAGGRTVRSTLTSRKL